MNWITHPEDIEQDPVNLARIESIKALSSPNGERHLIRFYGTRTYEWVFSSIEKRNNSYSSIFRIGKMKPVSE